MPKIHPTAVVGRDVILADDVEIGPGCCLEGSIRIGAGTLLLGSAWLKGPLTIGQGNRIYPFCTIGYEPQDYKFDPARTGAGVVIGDRNLIREQVSIHRATNDDHPTRIGDDCMLMVGAHLGHDTVIGNRCVITNLTLLGGHVTFEDQVTTGGGTAFGQRTVVGRLSFVGGTAYAVQNLLPFSFVRRSQRVSALNLIGMRRSGMPGPEIDAARWAFKVIYRQGNTRPRALEILRERAGESKAVSEIVDFLDRNPRPLTKWIDDDSEESAAT